MAGNRRHAGGMSSAMANLKNIDERGAAGRAALAAAVPWPAHRLIGYAKNWLYPDFPIGSVAAMWLNCMVFCVRSLSRNCLECVQCCWGRRRPRVMGVGPQPLSALARPLGALGLQAPRRRPARAVDYAHNRATRSAESTAWPLEMSLGNPDRAEKLPRSRRRCTRARPLR